MASIDVSTQAIPSHGISRPASVFKRLDEQNDIIKDQVYLSTKGLWSGDVGNLYNFFTSSLQTDLQKTYYYDVHQSASSDNGSAVQFSVSYGHRLGSGSSNSGGDADDTPSRAVYSQYRLLCLEPDDTKFSFKSGSSTVDSDSIYVINYSRARMQDKLDPGNFEVVLAQLTGSSANNANTGSNVSVATGSGILRLIDDSGDSDDSVSWQGLTSPVYNIVSGSISDGVYNSSIGYGLVYPDLGVIILNADKLDAVHGFGTVTGSAVDGDNSMKLFKSISGSASPTSERALLYPCVARSSELVTTEYYYIRVNNSSFNFSNNPTWVTGSNGQFKFRAFERDPKVYITSIGLYNDKYDLLAVAKLSQAVQKSFVSETLVTVKLEY